MGAAASATGAAEVPSKESEKDVDFGRDFDILSKLFCALVWLGSSVGRAGD